MYGYHGRYWRFDLSRGEGTLVSIDKDVLRRTIGGSGLGAWLLHREAPPEVDPLSPDAPLIYSFSPLVGSPLTTSAKFAVVAKSPLTGMISDALSSSHFAIAGKAMGVDAIVLVGACDEPSELVGGELRQASTWGLSAEATCTALRSEGRVSAIGVAGQNLVRYAILSNDGRHAGRGGLGAVMGSKRLKALVVSGEVKTQLANREHVLRIAKSLSARSLGPATAKYRELGTAGNLMAFNRLAALPTRNFQTSRMDEAEALSAEEMQPLREQARASCASCTIGCEHLYKLADGSQTRVEYENLFALGPLCGISDPDVVLAASQRCDELGLDTISTGGTIAFAMECAENGFLDGAPCFGDGEGMLTLIDDIAHRHGLGALLAEGSRRAPHEIGHGTLAFAAQVKGLEMPGYEPRALQTMGLGLAVSTRGADHNRSGAYELDFSDEVDRLRGDARAARLAVEPENRAALIDSLILCKFLRGALGDFYGEAAEMLEAVTGMDRGAAELEEAAARLVSLKKAFNIREGWTPADDTLPDRFLEEALSDGPMAGTRLTRERLAEMIRSYNRARGWTDDGFLPKDALDELGIETPTP
ncbi:MAG: aldehyde ferredoxin oxidoreductase family protein [Acidobacteriota bacterium]|nr:aldehyde ferredoxin oxidoreductase family protein [Acidobacteriota bacterium]